MELLKNNFFIITVDDDSKVFINVFKAGYTMTEFNSLLTKYPRINISKFLLLKQAIKEATCETVQIGELKPLVTCKISQDKMVAKIHFHCSNEELNENKLLYIPKAIELLHSKGVTDGISLDVLHQQLEAKKDIVVARGVEPVNGEDSIVSYYKMSERKPTIREDGKADYFDMNFIDVVEAGEWLGEKIPPTTGKAGRTVLGSLLFPKKGKDKVLYYDKKTVKKEELENGKVVLRAVIDGVVQIENGKLSIGDHLVINGDVGVETGNINFDGSVTIKGIVQDGYSVIATKDISIMSEIGISRVKLIQSKTGDVFIKGGVFGKGVTNIVSGQDIFVKYANECTLTSKRNINVGYYAIGCTIKATNLYAHEYKGKIIGGEVEARASVTAGFIGNEMEKPTVVIVEGFDRDEIKKELEELLKNYKKAVQKTESTKMLLDNYNHSDLVENDQEYERLRHKFDEQVTEVSNFEQSRKGLTELLNLKGDGQVSIFQKVYPETFIQIKKQTKKLKSPSKGVFYVVDKQLHID
ncbi:FapA family protein [Cytobacillus sp. IB215316]|uniref:DUF342 domain-containing protein n=1 Tax=Cytobacillus sp. IB215316 TaxID=3097354 RepID=UPI002A12F4EA|nr:FapA family protein [Cytobacillus sp. IB215316]MDX8359656.1 FapA family protein [Cytobacillus sp. IB215316]